MNGSQDRTKLPRSASGHNTKCHKFKISIMYKLENLNNF